MKLKPMLRVVICWNFVLMAGLFSYLCAATVSISSAGYSEDLYCSELAEILSVSARPSVIFPARAQNNNSRGSRF